MHSLQFWKNWPAAYQRLWWALFTGFIIAALFTIISLIQYPAPVYTWQQFQSLKDSEIALRMFDVAEFDLTLFADNHIVFERWLGNRLSLSTTPLNLYLLLFALGFTALLAIITVLPRFWFLAAAGVAVFAISNMHLDGLGIFGLYNKIPTTVAMILLAGPAVYFQFFGNQTSFQARFITILTATAVAAITISRFSTEAHPLQYFAVSTIPISIVLILCFIILVSHEVLASFATLVGQGGNSNNLRHYLIISSVYLINLWLTYWDRIGWIDWNFTLNPLLLLCISGILAVWGILQRQSMYENIIDTEPFGVYFILALGTIALGLTGFFLATANDIALLSIRDIIIYAHIGYGMMFIVYLASNFMGMLQKNLPVWKVLYKPTAMPYFSYVIGGLVFTIALLAYNRWIVPVNHFFSAYYTAVGDHFILNEDPTPAMGYYQRAHFYASYNQHAATALAQLEASRSNTDKEESYVRDANSYKPTPFTLLNEARILSGKPLQEIALLQDANKLLPKSGAIENNIGLAYARLGLLDSAHRFLVLAKNHKETRQAAEMNLLGLFAEKNLNMNADSAYRATRADDKAQGNAWALANARGKFIEDEISLPADSALNLFDATRIGNYLINHIGKTDTAFLTKAIALARKDVNRSYGELILVPAAQACYATGQVNKAFEILTGLIYRGAKPGKHNTTLALWALDQGHPEAAAPFLAAATKEKFGDAALVNAVILAETGHINESIVAWDTVAAKKDSSIRSISESMKRVLAGPAVWYADFTDLEKYRYLRYRVSLEDSVTFEKLLPQIKNENLRARAILDRAKKIFNEGDPSRAQNTYNNLQGLHLDDVRLFSDIKYFELRLFASQGLYALVDEQIQKGIDLGAYHQHERIYYEALLQYSKGDTTNASKNLLWIAGNNYYFEDGVLAAASYFVNKNNIARAYTILSEAIQVNGSSTRILKAYIPVAVARGYDNYAVGALATLRTKISAASFKKYVAENQLSGLLSD